MATEEIPTTYFVTVTNQGAEPDSPLVYYHIPAQTRGKREGL